MGATKDVMLDEIDKARIKEAWAALKESPLAVAAECSRCGRWFPKTKVDEGFICQDCWEDVASKE